jgi:hypothetical protein
MVELHKRILILPELQSIRLHAASLALGERDLLNRWRYLIMSPSTLSHHKQQQCQNPGEHAGALALYRLGTPTSVGILATVADRTVS